MCDGRKSSCMETSQMMDFIPFSALLWHNMSKLAFRPTGNYAGQKPLVVDSPQQSVISSTVGAEKTEEDVHPDVFRYPYAMSRTPIPFPRHMRAQRMGGRRETEWGAAVSPAA